MLVHKPSHMNGFPPLGYVIFRVLCHKRSQYLPSPRNGNDPYFSLFAKTLMLE